MELKLLLKLAIKNLAKKNNIIFYISLLFFIFLIFCSIFPEQIAPKNPNVTDFGSILLAPSESNYLGTDQLGRDVLSRIIYGSRISLSIAFFCSIISLILGGIYGLVSGIYGGILDEILMKLVDVFYSIPDLLLVSIFILIFGKGLLGITLALSLLSWMRIARITRASVMELKNLPFIINAKISGFSKIHIMFKELLPNLVGPLIVTFTFTIPSSILAESTLSFLGIGISPPDISWGLMANSGWQGLRSYPHLIINPCIAIFLSTLCFLNIGNYMKKRFV